MKFTVELKPFLKMIELVSKKMPNERRADKTLRLIAAQARVFVESNQTVAGAESLVLADGQCSLPRKKFLAILKTYKGRQHLTFEVDARGLRIGNFVMPVAGFSSQAKAPGKFQVFPVTDLHVLLPDTQPSETGAEELPAQCTPIAAPSQEARLNQLAAQEVAENPPLFASELEAKPSIGEQEGSFPIAEDEMHLVEEVVRFARRFCALPKITPEQLAGLAHALFALERLPRISKGVAVEFSLSIRSGKENDYTELCVTFQISDGCFSVGTMFANYDPVVGGDHHTTTVYEVDNGGYRSMEAGDDDAWLQVFDWINHVDGLLNENSPEGLRLFVSDDSTPDCMATGDEK